MSFRRRILNRRVLALTAVAAMASLGAGLAATAPSATAAKVHAQRESSSNWSGYVVSSKRGQSFSSVSGSWVQPSVNASTSTSQSSSAFWVGLGGSSDQSQALEQVGTEADVTGGQTTYHAWYELVPAAQQPLDVAIHPGDHISAKVTVDGSSVTVSLSDDTTGQSQTKTLPMSNPDTSSAEWIAEAPAAETAGGFTILPLADFGKVTFTDATATSDGHTGTIADSAWNVARVNLGSGNVSVSGPVYTMYSAGQSAGASTGTVSSDGRSFTVSYSAASAQSPAEQGIPGDYGYGYGGGGYGYGWGYGYWYPGAY
jgi:Peptidase A4 family